MNLKYFSIAVSNLDFYIYYIYLFTFLICNILTIDVNVNFGEGTSRIINEDVIITREAVIATFFSEIVFFSEKSFKYTADYYLLSYF